MKEDKNKKPKILFVVPPSKAQIGKLKPYHYPHTGIGYLMSYLNKMNIETRVVDTSLNVSKIEEVLLAAIKKHKPDLIGLSLYSNVSQEGEKIVRIIKDHFSIPIVVGGPHISCTKEEFLKKTDVDFGVIKEGERPLFKLIKALFINKNKNLNKQLNAFSKIPGLIYRNKKGEFVVNENNDLIEDLDSIPFPDYFSFGPENYGGYKEKTYMMITSRGCPYQCSYCAAPLCTGRRFRTRSAKNVVDEIELWAKRGMKNIGIFDDSFNQDIDRAKEVCRELLKRNLGVTFDLYNGLRANRVDRELLELLKKAGCTFVAFGMESGNEEVLKSIGKNLTKKEMISVINLANEVGIHTAVNFILGHPGETLKTAMDTLNFAKELKCSYVNILQLTPIPGTRAYEQLKDKATYFYDEDYYLSNIVAQSIEPIFETPELTREQRVRLYKIGRNICKKSVFQFRFGKTLGWFFYILLYNDKLFKLAFTVIETTHLGAIYNQIKKK